MGREPSQAMRRLVAAVAIVAACAPVPARAHAEQMNVFYRGDDAPVFEPSDMFVTMRGEVSGTSEGQMQVGAGTLEIGVRGELVPLRRLVVTDLRAHEDHVDRWHVTGVAIETPSCSWSVLSEGTHSNATMRLEPGVGCDTSDTLDFYGDLDVTRHSLWRVTGSGTTTQPDGTTWSLSLDLTAYHPPLPYRPTQGSGGGRLTWSGLSGTGSSDFDVVCMELTADEFGNGYDAYVRALAVTHSGRLFSFALDNYRWNDHGQPTTHTTDLIAIRAGTVPLLDFIDGPCPLPYDPLSPIDTGAFSVLQI